MSVVGYDFGNETCVIAVARRRVIDVLQNMSGHRKTPTMVGFQGSQRLFGDDASAQYMNNYKNTMRCIKRLIGRQFDDPELKEEQLYVPNKLVKLPNGNVGVSISYNDEQQVFTIEQLAGALFTKLKQITEHRLETKVSDCVIACPPYWSDAQRKSLLDAAQIAQLNVLRLMNEPTAVALSYGILRSLPEKDPIKVLFVDVGNASTNVSLVSFVAGKLQVLGLASDRNFGARNFDRVLVDHFAKFIKEKYKLDVMSDTKASLKLLKECERIKTTLSANAVVPFSVEYIMNDTDVSGSITRQEFEDLSANLVKRVLVPIEQVLQQAQVKKEDIFAIEIVGGGVRIPAVARTLKDYFGRELSRTCDGDESVARGCALACAMLSPTIQVRQFEMHDVTPFGIDVAWGPAPKDLNNPAEMEDHALLFKARDAIPSVKLISFKERPAFQLLARYANPELLPPSSSPVIARFVVSGSQPSADPSAAPGKIKIKIKLDLNNFISITSAQLLQDVKVEEPDVPMTDAKPLPNGAAPASAPAPTAAPAKPEDSPAPMEDDDDEATKAAAAAAAAATAANPAAAADSTSSSAGGKKFSVKTERHNLKVESTYFAGLSKPELDSYMEKEVAMDAQDRNIAETNEKRNELESYVLEMRNQLNAALEKFIAPADRQTLLAALDQTESWLYDGGLDAQKSEFVSRLKTLRESGDPVHRRKFEADNREAAVSMVKSTIGKYQNLANSADEKYAHISREERDKVVAECNNLDQWLSQALSKQDRVSPFQDPAVTCQELHGKAVALENSCSAVMNKPKPAPPKPEPKPADPAPAQPQPTQPAQPAPEAAGSSNDVPMPDAAPATPASASDKKMDLD